MSAPLDTWSLVETEFDVRHNRHIEGLLAIGSGPLQQRAALEEGLAGAPQNLSYLRVMGNVTIERFADCPSRVGTYLPGVSGPHPTCRDEMINLPAIHGLVLYSGTEQLDMEASRISDYERRLDLRTGRLSRRFVWDTRRGARLLVRFERFISAKRRHLMALRCQVEHISGPAAELRVVASIDADVRTNGFDHFESIDITGEQEPITVRVRTNGGDDVAAAAILTSSHDVHSAVETGARWAGLCAFVHIEPNEAVIIDKFAVLTSSRHTRGAPLEVARRFVWDAVGRGYDQLAAESDEIWARRWAQTDVTIEGDAVSQLALRVSLYHMLRAVVEDDPRVAIDAKAAAGEAYCGRYFWDTEIFMLPLFLYTRPAVGKNLAAFRLQSLAGARRNARRYGYPGARFAWESSPAGDENCPNWQYCDHEVHVTADVVHGLWHAHTVDPQDAHFLASATEVFTECARYWCERVTLDESSGDYSILMVMGPDEYTPFSRNNAYTNHMVAWSLNQTCQAWRDLRARDQSRADELCSRLNVSDAELARFAEIAAHLRIPMDKQRQLVLQCDDFFDYEPFDADRWWPDRSRPAGACVSQERLYRSRILKQADVLQLMALAPHDYSIAQMRAAYDEYAPLTSHDSSLSKSTHAIIAAWIGRDEEALRWWDESVGLDLRAGEAAEGIHAACAGANWQVAVFGFAGLRSRMQSDVLYIDPHLPRRWQALKFPFVWDGQPLTITVRHGQVTIEHAGEAPLDALHRRPAAEARPGADTRNQDNVASVSRARRRPRFSVAKESGRHAGGRC